MQPKHNRRLNRSSEPSASEGIGTLNVLLHYQQAKRPHRRPAEGLWDVMSDPRQFADQRLLVSETRKSN